MDALTMITAGCTVSACARLGRTKPKIKHTCIIEIPFFVSTIGSGMGGYYLYRLSLYYAKPITCQVIVFIENKANLFHFAS